MSSDKQIIVRLLSSTEHAMPKKKLLLTIKDSGTDRYDKDKKQVFDYLYGPHRVDFFGTIIEAKDLETALPRMVEEFGQKTLGDRHRYVAPDIAIVYRADKCEMVQHVYEERLTSDCFRFMGNPKEALMEVREL